MFTREAVSRRINIVPASLKYPRQIFERTILYLNHHFTAGLEALNGPHEAAP
jgi:hypothetical protein